jgi:hypothetical protein
MDGEVIGEVYAVEFVADDKREDGDRQPGTYVTIRVPDGSAWSAGTVIIRYTDSAKN